MNRKLNRIIQNYIEENCSPKFIPICSVCEITAYTHEIFEDKLNGNYYCRSCLVNDLLKDKQFLKDNNIKG